MSPASQRRTVLCRIASSRVASTMVSDSSARWSSSASVSKTPSCARAFHFAYRACRAEIVDQGLVDPVGAVRSPARLLRQDQRRAPGLDRAEIAGLVRTAFDQRVELRVEPRRDTTGQRRQAGRVREVGEGVGHRLAVVERGDFHRQQVGLLDRQRHRLAAPAGVVGQRVDRAEQPAFQRAIGRGDLPDRRGAGPDREVGFGRGVASRQGEQGQGRQGRANRCAHPVTGRETP